MSRSIPTRYGALTALGMLLSVGVGVAIAQSKSPVPEPWVPANANDPQLAKNVRLALDLTLAEDDHDMDKVASLLSDDFQSHNPDVGPGKQGDIEYLTPLLSGPVRPHTGVLRNRLVKAAAVGDMVYMIFMIPTPDPDDKTKSYDCIHFEAYRIAGNKIAEHWDGKEYKQSSWEWSLKRR
jgi:predicted SnoaL-like aldol condensation-catalyzing enzyme